MTKAKEKNISLCTESIWNVSVQLHTKGTQEFRLCVFCPFFHEKCWVAKFLVDRIVAKASVTSPLTVSNALFAHFCPYMDPASCLAKRANSGSLVVKTHQCHLSCSRGTISVFAAFRCSCEGGGNLPVSYPCLLGIPSRRYHWDFWC